MELGRLHEEEKIVQKQIKAALEKENLSHERAGAGDGGAEAGVSNTSSIQGASDEVQGKVDRFHAKHDMSGYLLVSKSSKNLSDATGGMGPQPHLL